MSLAPFGRRLRVAEAAAYLGVTTKALKQMVHRGQIASHQFGPRGHHFFYETELDAHVQATRVQGSVRAVVATGSRNVEHLMPATREFS